MGRLGPRDARGDPAPHTGAVIGYNALAEPYYAARFAGGRRVTG